MYMYYEPEQSRSPYGYFGLSVLLHIGLVAALAVMVSMQIKKNPPVLIEFEVLPNKGVQTDSFSAAAPAPASQQPIQTETISQVPEAFKDLEPAPAAKNEILVAKPKAKKQIAKKHATKPSLSGSKVKTAKTQAKPSSKIATKLPAKMKVAGSALKVEPITQEYDEPAPEIPVDDGKDLAALNSNLSESDISDDLSEIDKKSNGDDSREKNLLAEMEEEQSQVEKESAALIATEKARLAEAQKQSEERIRQGQARVASRYGGTGMSADGNGTTPSTTNGTNMAAYGVPTGVRRLEQLKQVPGNRKPEYSFEDRRAGKQGHVIYYAYVNAQGAPIRFTMMRSTGFESLDQRTLAALKTWKFYPGQEGWVELPFIWSLKGGPVEAPSTLRRTLSQR